MGLPVQYLILARLKETLALDSELLIAILQLYQVCTVDACIHAVFQCSD